MINSLKLSHSTSFFILLLLIVVFRVFLDYGYSEFVYPLFSYSGFTLDFSSTKFVISWISVTIILVLIYIKRKSPLIYIYFVVYTLNFIPTSSYYALTGKGVSYFWVSTVVYSILLLSLSGSKKYSLKNKLPPSKNQRVLISFLFFLCIINLIFIIYNSGGNYVLSFADVYDFRSEHSASYSGIFGYLNNWSSKVFVPFIIAYSLANKNKVLTVLSIFLCFSFFIFTGHKSTLMPLILCIFIFFSFKSKSEDNKLLYFATLCLIGLLFFSGVGLLNFFLNNDIQFASVFLRRAFFTPVWLNDTYFEMFTHSYSSLYWSNSILSFINTYPYGDIAITKVVGSYVGSPDSGANTGFVASGFMQGKYIGITIYLFVLLLINSFLNRFAHRINPVIFNSVLIMPFITIFMSSDLPVGLVTHGLFIAILLMVIFSGILKIGK